MAAKTVCPITYAQFKTSAKPLEVAIAGKTLQAPTKEFSTGSLGWYLSGKISVEIDGKPVQVQVGLNMTIIGSKDVPKDGAPTDSQAPGQGNV